MTNDIFTETLGKASRAREFLGKVIEEYGVENVIVANSFGKDSMVTYHLARNVNPNISCFSVMTKYKPAETFELIDRVIREWNLYKVPKDRTFPKDMMGKKPMIKIFKYRGSIPEKEYAQDPKRCCKRLKVIPTLEALKETGVKAWITGLRRTEGKTREEYKSVEEYSDDVVKINPLIGTPGFGVELFDWSELDVWKYTAVNRIPTNALYGEGYRSLGCEPCSGIGGESERSMRWKGTVKCGGECGIHTANMPESSLDRMMEGVKSNL